MSSYVPRARKRMDCVSCGSEFLGHGNAMYCSNRCRNRTRELRRGANCKGCGRRVFRSPASRDEPLCQPCRRMQPGYRDRRASLEPERWACAACGAECSRPATRGQRPRWCDTCRRINRNRDIRVSKSGRVAIYLRDDWTCWLCREHVDPSLIGSTSMWRPSLDHIVPRVQGGSDEPSNLALAHWWCNSARSDGRTYTPEDFRAAV